MKVQYTGNADFQEFSAADFKKAEVDDQHKVRFAKGEPTEVSDAAGEALISEEGIFGQHSFEKVEDEGEAKSESNDVNEDVNLVEDAPAEEGKAATTEGTADSTTTAGTRSTGRGSSTRSR